MLFGDVGMQLLGLLCTMLLGMLWCSWGAGRSCGTAVYHAVLGCLGAAAGGVRRSCESSCLPWRRWWHRCFPDLVRMKLRKFFMTRFVAVFPILSKWPKCIATAVGRLSAATICFVNPTVFVSPFCHRPIIFGASIWPHFVWCVRNLSQLQRLQKNLIWGAERTLVLLLVYNCFSKKPQTRFNWNTYRENMENFRKCLISRRTLGISCANIVVVVFVHQVSKLKKLFASIFQLLMSCSDARRRTLLGQRRQTRAEWKVNCPKFRSYSWQNRQIHARNTSMNQYALDKFSFLIVSCTSVIRTTRIPRKQAGLTTQGRSTRFTLAFRSWSILCHGQSLCIVLGGPTNWRKNLGEIHLIW